MNNDDKSGSTKFEWVGKVRCPRRVIPILQAPIFLAHLSGTPSLRLAFRHLRGGAYNFGNKIHIK